MFFLTHAAGAPGNEDSRQSLSVGARKMRHAPRHGRGPKLRLQVQEESDLGGAEKHAKTFENNAQHKGIDSIARIYRGVGFYI
jgi:hypothetical protein